LVRWADRLSGRDKFRLTHGQAKLGFPMEDAQDIENY